MLMRTVRAGRRPLGSRPGHQRVGVALLLLGVWLSVAPFVLEYRASGIPLRAAVNDAMVGVAVFALALISICGSARSNR